MELLVELIRNNPIDSNCFVLYSYSNSDCIIVDPGTLDCKELLDFLLRKKLIPRYIILTHEHFDHIWGVSKLIELYDAKIVCSKKCFDLIIDKKRNLSLFYDQVGFEVYPVNLIVVSDEVLKFGNYMIKFKETPGHSVGSISFWVNDMLFTGDVLINNCKTVTKLPGGSKKVLEETINDLQYLFKEKNMVVYPGHGVIFRFNEIDFSKII